MNDTQIFITIGQFAFLALWVFAITRYAISKNRSPWAWGIASLFFTPLLTAIALMISGENKA